MRHDEVLMLGGIPDMTNQEDAASVTAARAREILELSSDSVTSELDHARSHLREAGFGGAAGYYRIEGVAGALGALANAWGRITLWARAIDAHDAHAARLTSLMDALVDVHTHLSAGTCGEPHVERLR